MTMGVSKSIVENEHGKMEIIPGSEVHALSWGSWKFRWTPSFDVHPGGGMELILMTRFPTNSWSLPQVSDPLAPGYVTANAQGDTLISINILRWPNVLIPHGAVMHIIQIDIGHRIVKKNEVIELIYGDKRGGSLGTQAQLSAREVAFPVFVSNARESKFLERFAIWNRQTDIATLREKSDFCPALCVIGGQASSFNVVAPMEVAPEEPFDIKITALDAVCNADINYEGSVEIKSTDQKADKSRLVKIKGVNNKIEKIVLKSPGFHRIFVIDANRGLLGISNPLRVLKNPNKIYWGELHGHSESSDGAGTVDEHYIYARDIALLDFAALADHDHILEKHPAMWKLASQKIKEYSHQGEFIAILAYEGRMRNKEGNGFADINVYYLSEQEEMLESFPVPLNPSILKGKDVLLIPHSSLYSDWVAMGTHWEYLKSMTKEMLPLVEIFSTHGNSEYFDCPRHVLWQGKNRSVVDALKQGFRVGFIGSSDYHEILLGNMLRIQDQPRTINNQHMQARCGLAAVRAKELSRASIYQAMKKRQTYATSGIRAYVAFSINGHDMGTEFTLSVPTEPRILKIAVAAPENITKIEVVKNGEVMIELADDNWFFETEITDTEPIQNGAFYYLRVTTERMDFAWSSPIWIDTLDKNK